MKKHFTILTKEEILKEDGVEKLLFDWGNVKNVNLLA